jgi:hypothetical protein
VSATYSAFTARFLLESPFGLVHTLHGRWIESGSRAWKSPRTGRHAGRRSTGGRGQECRAKYRLARAALDPAPKRSSRLRRRAEAQMAQGEAEVPLTASP